MTPTDESLPEKACLAGQAGQESQRIAAISSPSTLPATRIPRPGRNCFISATWARPRSAASASPPTTICSISKTSDSSARSCDRASVALDDEAVADFFDRQIDAGIQAVPGRPGSGPIPTPAPVHDRARPTKRRLPGYSAVPIGL